ncbi:MAG: hypothetical protein AB7G87_02790 [Clostridia bacterium]
MAGKNKTLGLVLGVLGAAILIAFILPLQLLVIIEGIILISIGWLFFRNG